jgi:TatD DNase family protein
MFIDTHCHLDFPEFNLDRDRVIKHAKDEGIDYIINIGSSIEGSRRSLELSSKYDYVYATVGIHPHEADSFNNKDEVILRELAQNAKVVAIGEIGLDYFKNYSKSENQRKLFICLIKLAKDFNLPLVIHTRQAQEDTLKILESALPLKAVVHCFSGNEDFLKSCLGLGFLVSFTCNITYPAKPFISGLDAAGEQVKKAPNLREIVKLTPLDRLLLETDAPYLSPEGFRGKRNEPIHVKLLAQEIARLKQVNVEEVGRITSINAIKFFNLK